MAAAPHGIRETALRLSLNLCLELDTLLADVVVLEAERAGELDERAGRGREKEGWWARKEGECVRLGAHVAQRATAARHECEADAEEENHAWVKCVSECAHAEEGLMYTFAQEDIPHS